MRYNEINGHPYRETFYERNRTMFKKITALFLLTFTLLSSLAFPSSAAGIADGYAQGIVSLYDGVQNTRDGHDPDAEVWEDLVGGNDLPITVDAVNRFNDEGLHLKSARHFFPQAIVNLVNGREFTVEMFLGELISLGNEFNTFINSSNDNFSLFRRLNTDALEFKFAANAPAERPTVAGALEMLPGSLVSVTYKVGGKTVIYVNGKKAAEASSPNAMGANDLFLGHPDVSRNYETTFRSVRFYDRALTAAEVLQNAQNDGVASDMPDAPDYVSVAQPATAIVGDIALVRRIDSAEELDTVVGSANKPSSVILRLNASAEITDADGGKICTVAEYLKKSNREILPIFETEDESAVNALSPVLSGLQFRDCAVMSKNPAVVRAARTAMPQIRGILDFTDTYAGKTALTAADLTSIRKSVKENLAYVAVLPLSAARKEAVQALYDSVVNVWVSAPDVPSETERYDALLSGALGVISDATDALLDSAAALPQHSMTRVPLNIGHRGLPSSYPENTLESAIAAYEAGADVVELDIYLTTDNEIVIMHDANTGRTCDRDLVIEKSTLGQLKSLTVNKGYENDGEKNYFEIPTLREYFEYFRDTDCRFFIEIKSAKPAIVPLMADLIEEYGMYDRCGVISFDANQLRETGLRYPEMSVGFLCSGILDEIDSDADMKSVMSSIGKLNATLNPSFSGYGSGAIRAALLRGVAVYPWTFDGAASNSYMLWGYSGLTSNTATAMTNFIRTLSVTCDTEATVGNTVPLLAQTTTYGRKTEEAKAAYTVLAGNDIAKIEGNQITFTGEGTFTFYASAENTRSIRYSLFTQPITITVKAAETVPETAAPAAEDPGKNPDSDQTGSVLLIVGAVLGAAVIALIVFILLKNGRKKKN